jgi:hypothetical protein
MMIINASLRCSRERSLNKLVGEKFGPVSN